MIVIKFRLLSYEIEINKIKKPSPDSIFREIEREFRDWYDRDRHLYYLVKKKDYTEILRLAREDYLRYCSDPEGEDEMFSYYNFEIVEHKFFNKVVFKVS